MLSITEAVGRKKRGKIKALCKHRESNELFHIQHALTRYLAVCRVSEWGREREKKRFHIFIETDLIYFLFNNREVCISCQGRRVLCMDFREWLVNSPCHRKARQPHETSHHIRWCHCSDTLSVRYALAARQFSLGSYSPIRESPVKEKIEEN